MAWAIFALLVEGTGAARPRTDIRPPDVRPGGTSSPSAQSARLANPMPQGLELVSMFRKNALNSGGNLLSIRTSALAQPDDLADVLDLDRADMHAGAAGRAGPDLALGVSVGNEGRQVIALGLEVLSPLKEMLLHIEQNHLRRKRLAAGEGRAGVLAAAAFHAGEGVQVVFPGEVGCLFEAEDLGFLEVDRAQLAARAAARGRTG